MTNLQTSLRRIGSDNDWVDISTSWSHALALKSDGTMWAWGENLSGQLGIGFADKSPRQLHPVPEPSVPGNDWHQVAAGHANSLALKKDGTLWAWGSNSRSRVLGVDSDQDYILQATQVGTDANWVKVWAGSMQ